MMTMTANKEARSASKRSGASNDTQGRTSLNRGAEVTARFRYVFPILSKFLVLAPRTPRLRVNPPAVSLCKRILRETHARVRDSYKAFD